MFENALEHKEKGKSPQLWRRSNMLRVVVMLNVVGIGNKTLRAYKPPAGSKGSPCIDKGRKVMGKVCDLRRICGALATRLLL